jgi:phosphatidylglycerophosphate synthase
MSPLVNWSKAEKFTGDAKYFNISVVWIFYYRYVIRLFYYLKFNPLTVLTMSILSGLLSSLFLFRESMILSAIFLHYKDIFDACDGSLARLTDQTSRLGRFLDSLGDMFVLTVLIAVVTFKAYDPSGNALYLVLGVITWLSLFIQCSYFNYYQLKYADSLKIDRLVAQTNENVKSDYSMKESTPLKILRIIYMLAYGWQDHIINAVNSVSLRYLKQRHGFDIAKWYRYKPFLVLNSALCFGTHIFVFIICIIFGKPTLALWIISCMFNLYFAVILIARILYFKARSKIAKSIDITG